MQDEVKTWKLLEINSSNFGSTGNIMLGIAKTACKDGMETYVCVPKSRSNSKKQTENQILIGNRFFRNLHLILGQITGYQGCFSVLSTWNFLRKISKINPDIVHLHNLHSNYINLPMLFRYIKKRSFNVVWTLHDCWAFTGQCPHFTMVKCERWKAGCEHCPQYKRYPKAYIDKTKTMWRRKKKWFTDVKNMTIVTPSIWLSELVKESYLSEYRIEVINNGIDLNIFRPRESKLRNKYGLETGYIILGVSFSWGVRKGLDVFSELQKKLDERYHIVLVGITDQDREKLPRGIITIPRTSNQKELAELYSAADVFVNPTREENYPTVNMEALACGTPVITFQTGGSPEIIDDTCGITVETDNVSQLIEAIDKIVVKKVIKSDDCIKRAKSFDMNERYKDYLKLYTEILGG